MRNDARPIGEDSNLKAGEGPQGEEERQSDREQHDGLDGAERGAEYIQNHEEDEDRTEKPSGA